MFLTFLGFAVVYLCLLVSWAIGQLITYLLSIQGLSRKYPATAIWKTETFIEEDIKYKNIGQ